MDFYGCSHKNPYEFTARKGKIDTFQLNHEILTIDCHSQYILESPL